MSTLHRAFSDSSNCWLVGGNGHKKPGGQRPTPCYLLVTRPVAICVDLEKCPPSTLQMVLDKCCKLFNVLRAW